MTDIHDERVGPVWDLFEMIGEPECPALLDELEYPQGEGVPHPASMRWLPGIAGWLSGSRAARVQQEGTDQGHRMVWGVAQPLDLFVQLDRAPVFGQLLGQHDR